ncbi:glycine cleavage system aminomethyltransferase GcvT [Actinoplanes oblitus]|uniref:aminomethyltransferase n=1 Tax=Actinoplanes oblitus TaxID=3040509 RepID=A0ABY8WA89_9ACTN|nr:glycine cleavage system aminomethyltransferase GcvT [Actinoplanes oblitus]WIM93358.1 glycine cleavage system aminomethyltransferase GcvT [Actinoplanes oblitus]
MRRTALHHVHQRLGASFTEFAGWEMPVRYGSDVAEHHAVRQSVGLFDLGHMGQIEVSGPEAAAFLDYALVGRLSAIAVGRAKYTMLCHTNGGVLDDLVVYRLEAQRFLVVANAANAPIVLAMLGEYSGGYAVTITALDRALLAVQGPDAVKIVGEHPELRYYGIEAERLAGKDVLLARTGYTGEDGFEIYCANEDAEAIWAWAAAAGAQPAGLACRDTLRLEAGMPLYGHELTVRTTPFHAGLGRIVALDKSDFVGAAALRAVVPDTELVGLVTRGRRSPRAGHAVLDAVTGAKVGEVTSGAPSPTLGHPIAMAYVATGTTAVVVDVRGTREDAEIVKLPFYKR